MPVSSNFFGLSAETIEKLRDIFHKHTNIERVILYGSRAKGNFRNGSDIDLTLIGDQISFEEYLAIEVEIDDLLLPYMVDLSLRHMITNQALLEHIDRCGHEFYIRAC